MTPCTVTSYKEWVEVLKQPDDAVVTIKGTVLLPPAEHGAWAATAWNASAVDGHKRRKLTLHVDRPGDGFRYDGPRGMTVYPLRFQSRVTCREVTFSGFPGPGWMVRVDYWAFLDMCAWEDIGFSPIESEGTSCLGGSPYAVSVDRNTFCRCCTDSQNHSHCLYLTAPRPAKMVEGGAAWINGNRFTRTGQCVTADGYGLDLRANQFGEPLPCPTGGRYLWPWPVTAENSEIAATGNRFRGLWNYCWRTDGQTFVKAMDENYYNEAEFQLCFERRVRAGANDLFRSASDWRKAGHDKNSTWGPGRKDT